jgi:DNA repair protein RecO (recombination protein O)
VSATEAGPYADRLLRLPAFVRDGGTAPWADILDGLTLSGHFLARDLLTDHSVPVAESRARLVERLRRAAGQA